MYGTNEQWFKQLFPPTLALCFDRAQWQRLGIPWDLLMTKQEFILMIYLSDAPRPSDKGVALVHFEECHRADLYYAIQNENQLLQKMCERANAQAELTLLRRRAKPLPTPEADTTVAPPPAVLIAPPAAAAAAVAPAIQPASPLPPVVVNRRVIVIKPRRTTAPPNIDWHSLMR